MDKKKKNNSENLDIFHEAANNFALDNIFNDIPEQLPDRSELMEKIRERIEGNVDQWEVLKKLIEGEFTEKFINALSAMPDKDFVRNYLRLLEFFKPKLMRGEISEPERDSVIKLELIHKNELGEDETIEIEGIILEDDKKDDLQE